MNEIAIWLLNFNYDNIVDLVYPYFKHYADKIHADLNIINERKFLDWDITYEKVQVYEKGKKYKLNMIFDTDVLIHKDFPDLTKVVNPYTIGLKDSYSHKTIFKDNKYFFRDGRYIGISAVFVMAYFYCHDIFEPLPKKETDYYPEIIMDEQEQARGVHPSRYITEYWLSNNLAKYGLKYQGIL